MRALAVFLLLTSVVCPAWGARPVTVAQLQQALAATHARRDEDLAFQIQDLRLTERLSATRLAEFDKMMLGKQSRDALRTIADESAFLAPPADEMPHAATPAIAEQRRILGMTVDYVHSVLPLLPNLLATRRTEHFEDMPQTAIAMAQTIRYQPLHPIRISSVSIVYRDGKDVIDDGRKRSRSDLQGETGLATQGIFGPFLALVLVDAARSQLSWERWESAQDGVRAVFQFKVPLVNSHYEVEYCCVPQAAAAQVAKLEAYKKVVGYHGDMAIDPVTGVIRRLMVEADIERGAPVTRSAIIVEYGPVEIGGKPYTCPLRSLTEIVGQIYQTNELYGFALANQMQPLRTLMNDASFSDYHVFRAETRLLAGEPPPENAPPPPAATTAAQSTPAEDESAATPAPAATTAQPTVPAAAAAALSAPPATPPPPAKEPEPAEVTLENGTPLTDTQVSGVPGSSPFTLRTTTRLVDVPVVAFDKKGRPITDLKADDFVLFDNGKKQKISFFSQAARDAAQPAAPPAASGTGTNQAAPVFSNTDVPASPQTARGATVLLIDSSNVAFSDLNWAKEEMKRFLKSADSAEPVGLYVLRAYGFEILMEPTVDHAAVAARLAKWMPTAQDLAQAQDEEQRNRQNIEWVHSAQDLAYVNGNQDLNPESYASGSSAAASAAAPVDAKLRSLGSTPGRNALSALTALGRHLAALPGHKALVWVASDNVLADWSGGAASREEKGNQFHQSLDLAAEEALNEAHVTIYPLDASQLEVGGIGADIGTRNVMVVGKSDRDSSLTAVGDAAPLMKPGREAAQMEQDTHPIAPEFRQLAEATGGRALRRAGDITAELNGIVNDGRAVYQLSFTPDTPADGQYHHITLEWSGKHLGSLHYRAGYLYRKEPVTMKDRVQDAIWEPGDAREIGVSATVEQVDGARKLRLNITTADLALSEQANRWMDRLDLITVMRDDAALRARTEGVTLALRLKPASYQSALHDGLSIDLPAPTVTESGTVRVLVIDRTSGRMGSVTIPAPLFLSSAHK